MKTKLHSFLAVLSILSLSLTTLSCSDDDNGIDVKFTNAKNGKITLPAGDSCNAKIKLSPDDKYHQVEFESSNQEIFFVNAYTGKITALKVGRADLIVKGVVDKDIKGKCQVVVTEGPGVAVSEISVHPDYASFKVFIPDEFELAEHITVKPEYAANKTVKYSIAPTTVATIDEVTGKITPISAGTATITIEATDGSEVKTTCTAVVTDERPRQYTPLSRTGWEVTASHATPSDLETVLGSPACLIDDPELLTCLSLVKPGKSLNHTGGTITVPSSDTVFFIIDMKTKTEFNYFKILQRTDNAVTLWVWSCDIYISDDNSTYTKIAENIALPHASQANDAEYRYDFTQKYSARYFKFVHKSWNTASSSSMQTRDFQIGNYVIL